MTETLSLDTLLGRIGDGAMLALPPDYSFVPMAAVRALAGRGARGLHLLTVPQAGIAADLLIGASCVATVETAAVSLGELGNAPRFCAAVEGGTVEILESTCPAIHAGLQAAEKGVPFMPLRGLIGSDLLGARPDWRVIDNPLADGRGDPIVLLPALRPDVALFHAPYADEHGNVWLGARRELVTMAHAAKETLVTVEEVRPGDLLADETLAAGTLPALYVTALAEARQGAWPLGLTGRYETDWENLTEYAPSRGERGGFRGLLRGVCRHRRDRPHRCGMNPQQTALLIDVIAGMLEGLGRVAVGASSPIPAAAAMLARERGGGRPALSMLGAASRERHDRRRARALRPRRPGANRRLLPGRRADRRRRQHQPGGHRAASRGEQALPRLLRLRLPLLRGAPRHPVPARAHAPHAGGQGGFRERAGHEPAGGLPAGRSLRAGDGALRLPLRRGARALPPRPRCTPATTWTRCAPPPASTSTATTTRPSRPRPTRRRWRCCVAPSARRSPRSTPASPPPFSAAGLEARRASAIFGRAQRGRRR